MKNYAHVTAEVVTITPTRAESLLSINDHNRKIGKANIKKLVTALEQGEFVLNGEPIIIAKNGRLMDGQHRLQACIEAQMPFTTVLVQGINTDVFTTIDTGATRKAADVLSIAFKDIAKPTRMANLIKMIIGYNVGKDSRSISPLKPPVLSNKEVLDYFIDNKEDIVRAYNKGTIMFKDYHNRELFSEQELMFFAYLGDAVDIAFGEYLEEFILLGFDRFEHKAFLLRKKGTNRPIREQIWYGFFDMYKRLIANEPLPKDWEWYNRFSKGSHIPKTPSLPRA